MKPPSDAMKKKTRRAYYMGIAETTFKKDTLNIKDIKDLLISRKNEFERKNFVKQNVEILSPK